MMICTRERARIQTVRTACWSCGGCKSTTGLERNNPTVNVHKDAI